MLLKAIDKMLNSYFKKEPDYSRLDGLEHDVWMRIRQQKTDKQAFFDILPTWDYTSVRYASLVLFIVTGLMASQLSPAKPQYDTLGLEVFSVNAPYLITSTLSYPDPAPS